MQNASGRAARKTMALAASGALMATAATAVVVTTTATSANAAKVNKTYTYTCKAVAGGIDLGPQKIKVTIKAKLPAKVKRGKAISKRPIGVQLAMPESLRKAAVEVMQATAASGKATNATLGVKIGKKAKKAKLTGLKAKKAPIPTKAGAKWKIATNGKAAAVKVPKKTKAKLVKLSVPAKFHVAAKMYKEDGSTIASTLDCKAPKKRAFGKVKVTR